MKYKLLIFLLLLILHSPVSGGSWTELNNTKIRSVCPPNNFNGIEYNFHNNCGAVVSAWSGAVYDFFKHRLIVIGGGHNDYYGNEVYAINWDTSTVERLTDPGPGFVVGGDCVDALPDGTPTSRHTYGNLAYIGDKNSVWLYGGSRGCGSGGFGDDTWLFDLFTLSWEKQVTTGRNPGRYGLVSAYYEPSGKVFVRGTKGFYSYHVESRVWERISSNEIVSAERGGGAINPLTGEFVHFHKDGIFRWAIETPSPNPIKQSDTNSLGFLERNRSPGVAWDSERELFVLWDGSDNALNIQSVYTVDPKLGWKWQEHENFSGPGGGTRGTFGRFAYSSDHNAFITVNSVDQNAFVFQFADPLDVEAPAAPSNVKIE